MTVEWLGPLYYPPVGRIAVMASNHRIEVWHDESEDAGCFAGFMLLPDRTHEQMVVHDLSCMWDRWQIDHIKEPTEQDTTLASRLTAHLPASATA